MSDASRTTLPGRLQSAVREAVSASHAVARGICVAAARVGRTDGAALARTVERATLAAGDRAVGRVLVSDGYQGLPLVADTLPESFDSLAVAYGEGAFPDYSDASMFAAHAILAYCDALASGASRTTAARAFQATLADGAAAWANGARSTYSDRPTVGEVSTARASARDAREDATRAARDAARVARRAARRLARR